MAKKGRGFSQDLSSFMCIILMMIGILVIIMITNVVTIISNPENIRITSLIQSAGVYGEGTQDTSAQQPFPHGNRSKEPSYLDVHKDHMVVFFSENPEAEIVSFRDLETPGNAFERMLSSVAAKKEEEYVILLARPGTATVLHRLRKIIRDRGVDLGFELWEDNRAIDYDTAARRSGRIEKK